MLRFPRLRSILFYSSSLACVAALFGLATTYGESHLQAPPKIDGRYQITAAKLPGCLEEKPLQLLIQQSGIYLSGAMVLGDDPTDLKRAEEKPSLNGSLTDRLFLQGLVEAALNCKDIVTVQGTLQQFSPADRSSPVVLRGVLQWGKAAPVNFTAQLERSEKAAE
jgi:hypothetical protein